MESRNTSPTVLAASLRSGLLAGAVCGLLFGIADALVAACVGSARLSALSFAGCLAAAILEYSVLWMAGLAAAAALLHPVLRWRGGAATTRAVLVLGLTVGLFAEMYWWTRPFVFYGRSSTSPERLAATAAMLVVATGLAWLFARIARRAPMGVWKLGGALLLAAWIGGGAYLVLQRNALGSRGEIGARNQDLPNVVLVVVDALRQDALGCYGNSTVKTPNVDRLAAEGVVFENAFTQAPFTWSSFGSILTGKYPRRHGLVEMKASVRMRPDNLTLPLLLKHATRKDGTRLEDRDWLAATFHTGTITEASGLLPGFDQRFEATAGHDLVVLDSPWSVFRSDLLLAMLRNKLGQHLELGGTAAEASEWIGQRGDRRFFAMVHLYSTHTPYDPPEEFRRMYCDPKYTGPVKAFYAEHRKTLESGKYEPTLADVRRIRDLYFAGVSQADAQIGWVVDALARKGVLDDTLVIVTADHGESLGEESQGARLWEHDHMVQTNLRIPLVMRWPKGLPKGKRVAAQVDEIDVLPTVCDLLGVGAPSDADEATRIDGKSLVPLVRGEKDAVREFSLAENGPHVSVQDARWKLVVPHEALIDEQGWKKALAGKPSVPRLYDLEHDSQEKFNLIRNEPEQAERLFAVVRDWNAKLPIPAASLVLSQRDIENNMRVIKGLGY